MSVSYMYFPVLASVLLTMPAVPHENPSGPSSTRDWGPNDGSQLSLTGQACNCNASLWAVSAGGNGHWYEAVSAPGVTWTSAHSAADDRGGYLATTTSAPELAYVYGLTDPDLHWHVNSFGHHVGPWLGGLQAVVPGEPDQGWQWVTGEPFEFTAWAPGQPNDAGIQDHLIFWNLLAPSPTWQDQNQGEWTVSYVIEWDTAPEDCPCSCVPAVGPEQLIVPDDGMAQHRFGYSLATYGTSAVFGARGDDAQGFNAGAAYVFDVVDGSWLQTQKLLASDGAGSSSFGFKVDIDDGVLVVTARYDNNENGNGAGSAYVFRRDKGSWFEEQRIVAIDGDALDYFGTDCSLDGEFLIVGSPHDDDVATDGGAGYVYQYQESQWELEQKLVAADIDDEHRFASAVDVDYPWIAAAAYGIAENSSLRGAVYMFHDVSGTSTWIEAQKLVAPDGEIGDEFGQSIDLVNDVLVVGASKHDDPAAQAGAAYVYRRQGTTWLFEQKLQPKDPAGGAQFGESVRLSEDRIVVGAWKDDGFGSAYLFTWDGSIWTETEKLSPPPPTDDDKFGFSSAISTDWVVVGAEYRNVLGTNSGSAFTYQLDPIASADCNDNGIDDLCELEAGTESDVNSNNIPDSCDLARGDVNLDGVVNVEDLVLVIADWGPCAPLCIGDTDGNGIVNVNDLVTVITNWDS